MALIALKSDHCLADTFKHDQPESSGLNQLQKTHQPKTPTFLKSTIFCHLELCPNSSIAVRRLLDD